MIPSIENFEKFPEKFVFKTLLVGKGISLEKNKNYWIRFKIDDTLCNINCILETSNFMKMSMFSPQNENYKNINFTPSMPIYERNYFSLKNIFIVKNDKKTGIMPM